MSTEHTAAAPTEAAAIRVTDLEKVYGGRRGVRALSGVTFDVRQGEVFALLGPNGAGKTTLLKILLDLVRPTGGEAHLNGHPAHHASARERLGYLPETNELPDVKTPLAFLLLMGSLNGITKDAARERADYLLETVGLADTSQPIKAFSKGMKRRLALAQAVMHEPDVLLLDEPTDGLDPLERERVTMLLRSLADEGTAILLCSHVLPEVEAVSDRYLVLHEGKSLLLGAVEELKGRSLQETFSEAIRGI